MSRIAIIPARGGSKRIEKKNIRDFLGLPIIAYSIKLAIASNLFDEIMVSTDDTEIAEIATKYGASVPFYRSAKNSDDYASTTAVIQEVIFNYKLLGREFNSICCLYATSPLTTINQLIDGFEKLSSSDFQIIYPVVRFGFPIWRGIVRKESGEVNYINPEYNKMRSQDLPIAYHDAGQWYWITAQALHNMDEAKSGSILLEEHQVQDIDNEIDWKLAEMKYKILNA